MRFEGRLDLSHWSLDSLGDVQRLIESSVTSEFSKAFQQSIEQGNANAFLPAAYWQNGGDEPPENPLELQINLGLNDDGESPAIYVDLQDALSADIEACAIHGSCSDGLSIIRDALRALADRIDAALKTGAK